MSKSSERRKSVLIQRTATAEQISRAFAQLSLHRFDVEHGGCSGETAQKMHRLEAAIELERILFWGENDGPKAA